MARWEVVLGKREIVGAIAKAAMAKQGFAPSENFTVNARYINGQLVFGERTLVELFDGYMEATIHTLESVAAVKEVFGGSRAGTNVLGGHRSRGMSEALRELLAFDDETLRAAFDELSVEMRQKLRERLRW